MRSSALSPASSRRRSLTDKERRILAYHEAGHALMSHLMGEVGHVQKVTIVSRGSALGYTLHLPNEDRYMEYEGRADRHS